MRPLGNLLLPLLVALLIPACGREGEQDAEAPEGRVGRIAEQVAEIRGLSFGDLPRFEVRPRAQLRPVLEEALRKQWGFERFARLIEVERRLGLFPGASGEEVIASWLDASLMLIEGYYDHETDTVLLVEEALGDEIEQDVLLAHELTHVLQARHRGISKLYDFTDCTNDAAAWRLALVEGEATLVQVEYMLRTLRDIMSEGGEGEGELADDVLPPQLASRSAILDTLTQGEPRTLMSFAYFDGARLLNAVEGAGGWEAVESLFAGSDLTTEIALHPEKLSDPVDRPTGIVHADLGDLLSGWTRILADTLGEAEIRAIFETVLPEATAALASIGWDGDSLLAYEEVGGERTGMIWALAFDSALDANQFKEAWIELGGHRPEVLGVHAISDRKLCLVSGFTEGLRGRVLARARTFMTREHAEDDLTAAQATTRAAEEEAVAAALARRGERMDGVLRFESKAAGMRVSVPEDWDRLGTVEEPMLFHRKSDAKLSLYAVVDEAQAEFLQEFRAKLAAAGTARELEGGQVDLAGRQASWRAFEVVGETEAVRIGVRLYTCPAEDGKRILVLIYPFEEEQQALAAVLSVLDSLEVIKQVGGAIPRPGGR